MSKFIHCLVLVTLFSSISVNAQKPDGAFLENQLKIQRQENIELKQQLDSIKDSAGSNPKFAPDVPEDVAAEWKTLARYFAGGVLIFGLILFLSILLFQYKRNFSLDTSVVQLLIIILVITAALFLIITGFSKEQITPIIGLLGTVIGFVFGANFKKGQNDASEGGAGTGSAARNT